jgi:hypothetical protein
MVVVVVTVVVGLGAVVVGGTGAVVGLAVVGTVVAGVLVAAVLFAVGRASPSPCVQLVPTAAISRATAVIR